MPRHGMNVTDKSKDFKGSIIKLFKNMNRFKKMLLTAMILALLSAILSTIAPNKLSELTDVISEGIKPNTNKLQIISKKIYENMSKNYFSQEKSFNSKKENIESSENEITSLFSKLDNNEKKQLLEEFTVDSVTISVDDQIIFMNIINKISTSKNKNNYVKYLDELPSSIKSLVVPKMNLQLILKKALFLAIIYIIGSLFGYIQGIIMAYVSNNYAKELRTDISIKINKLPLKYFDNHETGDILSRVSNDVDTIGTNMHQSLGTLVSNITLFLGSIVMMFYTNWIMALTAIVASFFGFVISISLLKKSQKYFTERQEFLGELNGHIEEIYSGHNIVKTCNGEEDALKEFKRINNSLYHSNRMSQFLSGIMQPIMGFIGNFGYVAVCVVGAILVMKDMTGFGSIVAFMIYIRLFTNPLSQIAQALTGMQSVAAASERVFEFMDETELTDETMIKNHLDKSKVKGNIEFKNVKFGYDRKKTIINNFNAKIKAGQKVAIVGPTGAGKTTMVNLLMKFYEINSGDILIDGTSIHNLTRENIHDLFVMVLQDTWLFDGTIADNIRYNKENVSEEQIWMACKTVGIDHFVKTLPGGLDSSVGDNELISSGQKQLITIARGMIEDAPFLILDEATSNVDTRTEELVQKAMDKLSEGRTSFIIAHRLSTIKNADMILVMDGGNIVEQGSHEELMKKNGFYAELYNSQFEL